MAESKTRAERWQEIVPSARRVRAQLAGEYVVDTTRAVLLRESGRPPFYWFPQEDVRTDLLTPSEYTREFEGHGTARYWHVEAGDTVAENAAWTYPDDPELAGYLTLSWHKIDAWFEEDEEIFVHPRDPFVRVDAIPSSRHVRVVIGGETVAETDSPVLLFETGLPTRYYIPKVDVRTDLLVRSGTRTYCPYKGEAQYYSVKLGDDVYRDIVWYYRYPLAEVHEVENLLCFYNERVDAIYVDGEQEEKPETP